MNQTLLYSIFEFDDFLEVHIFILTQDLRKRNLSGRTFQEGHDLPEWSNGDCDLDSTATRFTTLWHKRIDKKIEEDEKNSDHTYFK